MGDCSSSGGGVVVIKDELAGMEPASKFAIGHSTLMRHSLAGGGEGEAVVLLSAFSSVSSICLRLPMVCAKTSDEISNFRECSDLCLMGRNPSVTHLLNVLDRDPRTWKR